MASKNLKIVQEVTIISTMFVCLSVILLCQPRLASMFRMRARRRQWVKTVGRIRMRRKRLCPWLTISGRLETLIFKAITEFDQGAINIVCRIMWALSINRGQIIGSEVCQRPRRRQSHRRRNWIIKISSISTTSRDNKGNYKALHPLFPKTTLRPTSRSMMK